MEKLEVRCECHPYPLLSKEKLESWFEPKVKNESLTEKEEELMEEEAVLEREEFERQREDEALNLIDEVRGK